MTSPTSEPTTYNVPAKYMTRLKAAWTRYRSAQKELDESMTELEVATSWVLLDDEARGVREAEST